MSKETDDMTPAVILSTHTVGLAIIRALAEGQVPMVVFYYDDKDMGYLSKYVRRKIRCSHPENEEKRFLEELVDYAKGTKGAILFPADDATIKIVSKNKKLLEEHFIVACTDWATTERFIDKKYTYALAEEIGIPAPRTINPRSIEDVKKYGQSVDYPCLVKPCESHRYVEIFHRKMVLVSNLEEMLVAYKEAADVNLNVMIQEYIPGDDSAGVNYNSYIYEGEPVVEFTAVKVRLSPPQFGVPRVVRSKMVPEILAPARRLLKELGYHGYSCTEFKKDPRDGIYKLMEINGRHNRSALLSVRCGINFPLIEYKHLTRGEKPKAADFTENIYWIDEFKDVFQSLKSRREERYSIIEYLRPYFKRNVYAVFSWRDPMPFMKRLMDSVKMILGKENN